MIEKLHVLSAVGPGDVDVDVALYDHALLNLRNRADRLAGTPGKTPLAQSKARFKYYTYSPQLLRASTSGTSRIDWQGPLKVKIGLAKAQDLGGRLHVLSAVAACLNLGNRADALARASVKAVSQSAKHTQ